jgi:ABC-type bacteriocin/lantibiotic exporter with double-glycine peptidase domain
MGRAEMKIVLQDEPSGCGIACVAMLAGRSYEEVKRLANGMGIFAEDERLYSDTVYVRRLLAAYGVQLLDGETPFTSWEALPDRALLAIKYRIESSRPFWHWVVFTRASGVPIVLDPARYLRENRRADFDQMQPIWYIEVI